MRQAIQVLTLKHDLKLIFIVRLGLAATLQGLEWRGWRNSRGEEVPFRDGMGEEGVEEDMVLGLFLVQSLCSSGPTPRIRVAEDTCWVYVYKAIVDFV